MVSCADHGSDALIWAAGKGDDEHLLLEELLNLTGGAGVNRESHHGDTALTIACARQVGVASAGVAEGENGLGDGLLGGPVFPPP